MGSPPARPLGCTPVDSTGADVTEHAPVEAVDTLPAVDHDRLMHLVDELERDIALIEGAMAHVEAREFRAANAALDVLDGVSPA